MGDGPKAGAKWSKYSVGEDGTLTRKAEFCLAAVLEYSSQFTKIASPAVDAATQNPLLELRSPLNVVSESPFGVHFIRSGSC